MTNIASLKSNQGILEKIRAGTPSFSPAEQRVAKVVLANPLECLELSVTQLASVVEVSPSTVIRMCNQIGLKGYQELKTRLAVEHVPVEEQGASEPDVSLTANILQEFAAALSSSAKSIDGESVEKVAAQLIEARRIQIAAVGTSSMLAADFSYRLSMLGVDVVFIADVHAQHIQARMLGEEDVLFAVSHTGSTFETISAARAAKNAGAVVMALTSFSSSPLTELCEELIIAGSSETKIRVEATSSRLVHMAVLDALHTVLRSRIPQAEENLQAVADVIAEHRY